MNGSLHVHGCPSLYGKVSLRGPRHLSASQAHLIDCTSLDEGDIFAALYS